LTLPEWPGPDGSERFAHAALYLIEKTIRGSSAEHRRAVRAERSKPLVLASGRVV